MITYSTILENLRFLIIEVNKQIEATLTNLKDPSEARIDQIHMQDDYIDNLKTVIEKKCFLGLQHGDGESPDRRETDILMALNVVASNLERIGDYAVNIAKQSRHFSHRDFIDRYDYQSFFDELFGAMKILDDAVTHMNVNLAMKICRVEFDFDRMFQNVLQIIITDMKDSGDVENLLTTLFVFRYLERMGDSLLNIGERIISATIGERLKIRHFQALEESLAATNSNLQLGDIQYEAFAETRSGASIGKLQPAGQREGATGVIFKEGKLPKIEQEKTNLERWSELRPGLTPRVYDFHSSGNNASLLIEYKTGYNFQALLLNGEKGLVQRALTRLEATVQDVWSATKSGQPAQAGFTSQLRNRLPDILRVNPSLKTTARSIGAVQAKAFDSLLDQAAEIEKNLIAPFSVLIHGDLNIDNIIYDPARDALYLVDLHRSRDSDYIQDVSVFIVSNLRLPVFEKNIRKLMVYVVHGFLDFARDFARQNQDGTFEARLTLGLVRSLATSTRFILKRNHVQSMFRRSIYLLERLIAHQGRPWEEFTLPADVLDF